MLVEGPRGLDTMYNSNLKLTVFSSEGIEFKEKLVLYLVKVLPLLVC